MSKTGITCYRNGGCGPYEMYSCYECPASKSDYVQVKTAPKPTTHFDLIKSLSVEELAETYAGGCPNGDRLNCGKYYLHGGRDCFNCWLDWLKAPAEEVQDG